MANATEHIRRERELLIGGAGIPRLPSKLRGRPVLVVSREYQWQADISRLKRWIYDRDPVLIGGGNGVEALLDAGYRPDVAIGSLDEISDLALNEARHVVVAVSSEHGRSGSDRFEKAGVDPQWFIGSGASHDLALLLAEANDAVVIVEAGAPSGLTETLDAPPDHVATSFVTRLRMNNRVVHANVVGHLSSRAAATWPILLLLLGGLVAIAAAVAATPVGSEWLHGSGIAGRAIDGATSWIQGLMS